MWLIACVPWQWQQVLHVKPRRSADGAQVWWRQVGTTVQLHGAARQPHVSSWWRHHSRVFCCRGLPTEQHPMEFGAGYSFLSYNGVATMCVACDSTLLPEPQVLVNCIMDEYFMYEQAAGVSQPASSGPAPPIVALPNVAAAASPPVDVQAPAAAVDVAPGDAENESKQAPHTVSTGDVALSDGQV